MQPTLPKNDLELHKAFGTSIMFIYINAIKIKKSVQFSWDEKFR
jgi:hypothetical protein